MRLSNIVATSLLLAGFGTAASAVPLRLHERRRYLQRRSRRTRHVPRDQDRSAECARVDYFVDGQPFVSVVVDGEDRENWLARTTNPRILVQSCQVCRDTGAGPAAAAPARAAPPPAAENQAAADGDSGLEPLIAGVPEYPEAARARGLRGSVEVEFTVTPAGTVESPRVVAAEPRNVFDSAALAAVARRRYPADAERAPQVAARSASSSRRRRAAQAAAVSAGAAR